MLNCDVPIGGMRPIGVEDSSSRIGGVQQFGAPLIGVHAATCSTQTPLWRRRPPRGTATCDAEGRLIVSVMAIMFLPRRMSL
jgi:hypothetical protein